VENGSNFWPLLVTELEKNRHHEGTKARRIFWKKVKRQGMKDQVF
jgi:hypothetical protein